MVSCYILKNECYNDCYTMSRIYNVRLSIKKIYKTLTILINIYNILI